MPHQIAKEQPSEILNSSSNQNGKLQDKPPDIESSENESSLETSMPHGLDEANDIPSTIPFTQVKRTPYLSNDALQSRLSSSSPIGANKEFSCHSRGPGYPTPRIEQGSSVSQNNGSATDQHISMIEETVLPPGTLPEASKAPILPRNVGINSNLDQKRKASEIVLSPNVTKRRKAHKLDRVMSNLGITGRHVDPEDIGRQHRHEFFAHRKSMTAQSNSDGKDTTGNLCGSESGSTNSAQVINDVFPKSSTGSVIREDPNPPDEKAENLSEEKPTAVKTEPGVLAPLDVQTQVVTSETRTDNLDHNVPKESDVGRVHQAEIASSVIPSVETSTTACLPKTPDSVFDRFLITYPDYPGNSVQFAAICSRICALFHEDRMEHPSLWDDFIVRHRTEYPRYMSHCADEAVDPMPYERFYRSKVLQAKYVSPEGPVVTPVNIHEFQPLEPKHNASTTSGSSIGKFPRIATLNREGTESSADKFSRMATANLEETERSVGKLPRTATSNHEESESSFGKSPRIAAPNGEETESSVGKFSRMATSNREGTESTIGKFSRMATSNHAETERKSIEVIELSDHEDLSKPIEKANNRSMKDSKSKHVRRSLPWKNSGQVSDGESPNVKHIVSTPTAPVAKQPSSAKTSVFKEARQKATPVTPSAGKPSAGGEKTSSPLFLSRSPLINHHPPPKNRNSKPNEKRVERSNEMNLANDPHSPYNTWARNYQSITPGKGNSWCALVEKETQPKPKEKGNAKSQPKPKERGKPKPIDPFMFEL